MTDVELIRMFRDDPERAYRILLEDYSGVMLRMIRRFFKDADEVMEVYTAICERFTGHDYRALRQFDTSVRQLMPWLSVVVANACRDRLRKNRVVSMPQSVIDQLNPLERLVFQYYYQEHVPQEQIVEMIQARPDMTCTHLEVAEALERINRLLSTKKRWHLLAALHSSRPALSVDEMLEVGQELHIGWEAGDLLVEDERLLQVQQALDELDAEDRLLIYFRFEHEMTAQQIADALQFDQTTYVYSRLRTVLNRLRRRFNEEPR